jgi:hypothetical protein
VSLGGVIAARAELVGAILVRVVVVIGAAAVFDFT